MKKCLIFILTLMLALLPCAQAMAAENTYRHVSSLGYSIELDEYWFQLSPENVGGFAALLEVSEAEVPELMGFSADYITNFDNRVRDAFYNIGGDSTGGNVIIRRLDASESDSFGDLESFCSSMERNLLPMVESIGGETLLKPQISTIGARDFANYGFSLMDTVSYQYTTISALGVWYELTFTAINEDDTFAMLESVGFEGEDAQAVPSGAGEADPDDDTPKVYNLAITEKFDAANPPYEGSWRRFEEVGLRVYLPDSLVEDALTETDIANDYRYSGTLPSGNSLAVFVSAPMGDDYNQTDFIDEMTAIYPSTELCLNPVGDFVMATVYQSEDGYFENSLYEPHSGRMFSIVVFAYAPENIEEICKIASSIQYIPESPVYNLSVADTFDSSNPPYEGSWMRFADSGLRVYVPASITEDAAATVAGTNYHGVAESGESFVIEQYELGLDTYDRDDQIDFIKEVYGVTDVYACQVNGVELLSTQSKENNYLFYLAVNPELGMCLDMTIYYGEEVNAELYNTVASSIQPIPDVPVFDLAVPDTFDAENPPYEGEWVEFAESGMRVYMPAELESLEITEEELADDIYYYGYTGNSGNYMVMQYESDAGTWNFDDVYDNYLSICGEENICISQVGGQEMISLYNADGDYFCYIMLNEETGMFFDMSVFIENPTEDNAKFFAQVASSIQPIPEEVPVYDLTVPDTFDTENPPYEGEWMEFKNEDLRIYIPSGMTEGTGLETSTLRYHGVTETGVEFFIHINKPNSDYNQDAQSRDMRILNKIPQVYASQKDGLTFLSGQSAYNYLYYQVFNHETKAFLNLLISFTEDVNADFYNTVASSIQKIPEATPVYDLTVPDTFDEANPPYEGEWVEFAESGMRIYVPSAYEPLEITEEDIAEDMYFYATDENGGVFSVMQYAADLSVDYAGNLYQHYCAQVGEENICLNHVGGIDLITIYWPETGYFNYFMVNSETEMFFDLFIVSGDTPDTQFYNAIASSIQPIPEPPVDPTHFEPFDEANPPYEGKWMEIEGYDMRIYLPDSITESNPAASDLFTGRMQDAASFHVRPRDNWESGKTVDNLFNFWKSFYEGKNANVYQVAIGDIPVVIVDSRALDMYSFYVLDGSPEFNRYFEIYIDYETIAMVDDQFEPDVATYNAILSSLQRIVPEEQPVTGISGEDIFRRLKGLLGGSDAAVEEPVQEEEGFIATDYISIEIENYGTITAELYGEEAPITVENFMRLVDEGFYDGLTFHRIISGFMIQGGDPEGTGRGGSSTRIKGEFSQNGVQNDILHLRGALSMARSSAPDSASSQFFIMHEDAPHLDGGYAAFGMVISGMDVVDAICANTPVNDPNGMVAAGNQPKIVSIKRIENPAA